MSDLIAFLTDRQGRQIDPKAFPEAILNGSRLDLFNLYRWGPYVLMGFMVANTYSNTDSVTDSKLDDWTGGCCCAW